MGVSDFFGMGKRPVVGQRTLPGGEGGRPPRPVLKVIHANEGDAVAAGQPAPQVLAQAARQSMPEHVKVDLNGARVLTAEEGGVFWVPVECRDMLCLTSDDVLYVSSSHATDIYVLSFLERLERRGKRVRRVDVPLTVLRELYAQWAQQRPQGQTGAGRVAEDVTHRQREVVKFIRECVAMGASDIHYRVKSETTEVWIRIHGELRKHAEYTRQHGQDLCATMYQSMCDVAEEFHKPEQSQDGRLKKEYLRACGLFGARIATRPTDRGYLMVLRLLYDHRGHKPTMEDLGYLNEQIALIRRMTQRTFGINIFSGPTGSGKSTTLECLLSMLLTQFNQKINLLTIEDPPEYEVSGAVQTPIICDRKDPDAVSREWASAISNAMRLDPDVMMVGEMRDFNSASAAFRAAMTGHGLWTTLHANDVTSILSRLQDMGVQLSLLTDAALITGLINQSLAPVLCPHCKVPFRDARRHMASDLVARVERECEVDSVFTLGPGCEHAGCRGGVVGRTVIGEVIMPTQAFMTVFQREGKAASRNFWVREMGGITKNQHLIRKINSGEIDPAQAEHRVCPLDYDHFTLV